MIPMALATSLLLFGGCGSQEESLEERFIQCRGWVLEKESRKESMDCWTAHSRDLLERLLDQRRTSGGALDYMERYKKLLDYEDVVAAPEVYDTIALLTVGKGKRRETIVFQLEADEWKIDALELAAFWAPLDEKVVLQ